MKTSNSKYMLVMFLFSLFISCNEKNDAGTTTSEGTQLEDQRPNQNEGSASGNVDTITSPGSNSVDLRSNTDSDVNMQNQSATHGNDTQSGDNGTGNVQSAK